MAEGRDWSIETSAAKNYQNSSILRSFSDENLEPQGGNMPRSETWSNFDTNSGGYQGGQSLQDQSKMYRSQTESFFERKQAENAARPR